MGAIEGDVIDQAVRFPRWRRGGARMASPCQKHFATTEIDFHAAVAHRYLDVFPR
jgi:hypothetical protein